MDLPASKNILDDIRLCIGFFTRLPVGGRSGRRFAEAIWAAPVAGIVVGLIGFAVFACLEMFGLPRTVAAAGALGTTMLATGALHEDGLADVADGFGGGATRARKLEIMKDSRIGTYGVLALILGVLVRWSAITALPGLWAVCFGLVGAHAASRATLPAFMAIVPPARPDGLSAATGQVERSTALAAALVGIACLLPLGLAAAVVAAVLLAAWALGLKIVCERQIGGQTGDVLGFLQQGGEVIVLVTALAMSA